ncbi:MAG: hypothetical protein QNJ97_13475 [Myxococcota bacterium]|nr:hypothetical protein [Myxococcota bacterium]
MEQKPQNPIAAKQALYNKDPREHKVSLAQGMVFNDQDRIRVYDPKTGTWFDSMADATAGGCAPKGCEVFKNKAGKIFHSPAVFVAHRRALDRFEQSQFGDDTAQNPAAYGTPTGPLFQEALAFDGDDIYGEGKYAAEQTVSFQTLGMASGYRHLVLPVLNSVRKSLDLPLFETIAMGTNFYGAYPATFADQNIYRYRYATENGEFDLASFEKATQLLDPQTTLFLFDMSCGNNFVGIKRTRQDNENIAQILIDKKFYSEHDIAYPNLDQAFDLDWELYRILQTAGAPHGVQSSRGKKDKYASRLAFHHIYLGSSEQRSEIFTHLVSENRSKFLAMPDTWSYLVEIARDPLLKEAHESDNRVFVDIVNSSRTNLAEALNWGWMTSRSGMFDMVNISHKGVDIMAQDFAIYAVPARNQDIIGPDGQPVGVTRIKHGIPKSKIQGVAEALQYAAQKHPSDAGKTNPDIILAR